MALNIGTMTFWYLKYRKNDWKGERAGRHDGAKECSYTVPTGNQVKRE